MKRNTMFAAAKAALVGVIMCGMATACQNGDSPLGSLLLTENNVSGSSKQSTQTAASADIQLANEQLEALAKALAISVTDKSVASWIHKKSVARFDGETNVLWQDLEADASKNWSKKVVGNIKNASGLVSPNALNQAITKLGKLFGGNVHLYWYNADKWDGTTTPIIAYTPLDEKLGNRTDAPGFDESGRKYIITEEIAKQRPVIIITRNERTDESGKIKKRISESLIGGVNKGNAKSQSSYIRLRMESFSISSSYEDWFSGGPEFVAHFRTTIDGNSFSEYPGWDLSGAIHPSECDGRILNSWTGASERSFYWDSVTHKTLYIKWTEEDPAPIFTGSLSISLTGEFKLWDFTIKPNGNFSLTLPSVTTTQLQGWSIHNDHPAYPYSPLRSYNGGNPSTVVRFDP